eukprot:Blabericola_migrator_1__4036@NODE_2227_length_3093_cov_236_911104_g1403_i0_p3_GENE_NODE_2227_length_3093_cov_236_911104_g1403_i0NODE_2227_length_3093_cov_236_911104_g1403_i0_p3_ORF_typecomplete_len184_score21_20_NODE_2227_length_3093_cov_236_911104_g1403_i041592
MLSLLISLALVVEALGFDILNLAVDANCPAECRTLELDVSTWTDLEECLDLLSGSDVVGCKAFIEWAHDNVPTIEACPPEGSQNYLFIYPEANFTYGEYKHRHYVAFNEWHRYCGGNFYPAVPGTCDPVPGSKMTIWAGAGGSDAAYMSAVLQPANRSDCTGLLEPNATWGMTLYRFEYPQTN